MMSSDGIETSSNTDTIEVDPEELHSLVVANLMPLGLSGAEAGTVADVLLYAELRDKSQGLIKIVENTVVPSGQRSKIEVEARAAAIHLVHANGNAGMVVLDHATSVTVDTCAETGLALTGTRGTASSTGSIGYYAERIASAGYIGIVMAGSPKVMAVKGSLCRSMGTNPLAIAIPAGDSPLVFDMATAATTWFDLVQSARDNTPIQAGVALDKAGNPTLDAVAALEGVMLTFGGTKGSGLALMLEMLTGPLMGASLVGDKHDSRGNFILAINPSLMVDNFSQRVTQVLDAIRCGPLQAGYSQIRLPGEHSSALARKRLAAGRLPVSRTIYDQLKDAARSDC